VAYCIAFFIVFVAYCIAFFIVFVAFFITDNDNTSIKSNRVPRHHSIRQPNLQSQHIAMTTPTLNLDILHHTIPFIENAATLAKVALCCKDIKLVVSRHLRKLQQPYYISVPRAWLMAKRSRPRFINMLKSLPDGQHVILLCKSSSFGYRVEYRAADISAAYLLCQLLALHVVDIMSVPVQVLTPTQTRCPSIVKKIQNSAEARIVVGFSNKINSNSMDRVQRKLDGKPIRRTALNFQKMYYQELYHARVDISEFTVHDFYAGVTDVRS
jgi:hypothetical protein